MSGLVMTLEEDEILMCLAAHSQYFSSVEIVDSISLPVEVNNSSKLNLPVDSQYFSPVEIVDSISLPAEVNNSTKLYLPVDSQYSSPVEALQSN